MADYERYAGLREEGWSQDAAGIELVLTLREQAMFERQFSFDSQGPRSKAGGVYPAGMQTPPRLHHEDDETARLDLDARHVATVMRLGGFPRSLTNERGKTEWLGPDGRTWQAALRKKLRRAA